MRTAKTCIGIVNLRQYRRLALMPRLLSLPLVLLWPTTAPALTVTPITRYTTSDVSAQPPDRHTITSLPLPVTKYQSATAKAGLTTFCDERAKYSAQRFSTQHWFNSLTISPTATPTAHH